MVTFETLSSKANYMKGLERRQNDTLWMWNVRNGLERRQTLGFGSPRSVLMEEDRTDAVRGISHFFD